MNLAVRDIRYHLGRFVLTSIGLGLLLATVMAMGGIYQGLIYEATAFTRSVAADIWVIQKNTRGPFAESSRIPEDLHKSVAAVPGVLAASPLSFQNIQMEYKGKQLRFLIVGYDLEGFGGPPVIVRGRPIQRKHYEIVVDEKLGIAVAEHLPLGRNRFTVVGRTRGMVSTGGDAAVYMSLADAQEIQFLKNNEAIRNERARFSKRLASADPTLTLSAETVEEFSEALSQDTHIVNCVAVRVRPGNSIAEVSTAIERWMHYTALSNAAQEEILTRGLIEKARQQLGLFRAILVVISAVVIALVIYTFTLEKTREIATLKLIGAPRSRILGLIVEQSLLMGLVGYAVGLGLISNTYQYFPRLVILLTADLIILFGIVILICLAGSLLGVLKALRVEPALALQGGR